jgi:hypothetical protein
LKVKGWYGTQITGKMFQQFIILLISWRYHPPTKLSIVVERRLVGCSPNKSYLYPSFGGFSLSLCYSFEFYDLERRNIPNQTRLNWGNETEKS